VSPGTEERGWLIEARIADGPPCYWIGDGVSFESLDAVRFARKVDAERALPLTHMGPTACVAEHLWIGP